MVNAIAKFIISSSLLLGAVFAQTCGGPTYPCSVHQTAAQLTTIPLPVVPFSGLTGAGSCATVQPYGTQVCRCTDVNTDPSNVRLHSYEVTDTGGDFVYDWDVNQQFLQVVRQDTGSSIALFFDGQKCTANPNGIVSVGAQMSLQFPGTRYIPTSKTSVAKQVFDPANPLTAPATTSLFDFASCPLLSGIGTISFTGQINTNDDNLFFMLFGVNGQTQDKAQYIVTYRVDNRVCALFNTVTGAIQLAGGIPNVITIGQAAVPPFTLHSAYLAPAGQYMIGGRSQANTGVGYIWYPATTRLDSATVQTSGHGTTGFNLLFNLVSTPKFVSRTFAALNTVKPVNQANFTFPSPQETHMAWGNDNPTDTNPVCLSQVSQNQPQPIVIKVPLQNEMFCVDPTTGTYIRLSSSFTSGICNPYNFRTCQAIMVNGSKGYIAFSSDMGGTLGNTDGKTPTCTLGAAIPNACRSDVFIVIPR